MMQRSIENKALKPNMLSRRRFLSTLIGRRDEPEQREAVSEQISDEVRSVPRPPFAAPESCLQSLCTGCGACIQTCNYNLIQLDDDNKPTLNIDYLACNFCQDCVKSCPTDALNMVFKADTELRPQFNYHCVMSRGQHCDTCIDSCPQQAITAVGQKVVVDASICNGCGECKVACFANGIELALP